jgi:hypothetical protein
MQSTAIGKLNTLTLPSKTHFWTWLWFSTTIVATLSAIGIFYWKDYQNNLFKENTIQHFSKQMVQREQYILKTLSKPLVWSMREYLLRKEYDKMDGFAHNIVEMKNFPTVNIADNQGIIVVSTNKLSQSTSALTQYAPPLFVQDSIVVLQKTPTIWVVAAPIMGYDHRIGTLLLDYIPNTLKLP